MTTVLAATLVAPDHDRVIPLEPEFIAPQDGAAKQDCETAAAKRWLAAHGRRYSALDAVYLGETCSPASRFARPCWTSVATSCSSASPPRTR